MSSAYDRSGTGLTATVQESFMVPVPKEGLRHSPREDAERFAQVCDGTGRRTETGGPALPCGPHRDHSHKGADTPGSISKRPLPKGQEELRSGKPALRGETRATFHTSAHRAKGCDLLTTCTGVKFPSLGCSSFQLRREVAGN